MVSSGLSHRRGRLPRPKVCKPPPPPPPPVPGYEWPTEFPLLWIAVWEWEEVEFSFSKWLNFVALTPGVLWEASDTVEENEWSGSLDLQPSLQIGMLTLGYQGEGDECGCSLVPWELVWMVSTAYVITVWTSYYPFGSSHEARFTF